MSTPVRVENPTTLASPNFDLVWDAVVSVVEKHFDIATENRYDGTIETQPQAAATLLEPWRSDSVGFRQRVEASLQTIRRRCFVLVQPAPGNGFTVTVEVYKELENLSQPAFAQFPGGSFISSIQPARESVVTSAVKTADGWISLGRDARIEERILRDIQRLVDNCSPTGR